MIGIFTKQWELFVNKMDGLGVTINTLQNKYEELHTTRVRQLEKQVEKINELRLNQTKEIEE